MPITAEIPKTHPKTAQSPAWKPRNEAVSYSSSSAESLSYYIYHRHSIILLRSLQNLEIAAISSLNFLLQNYLFGPQAVARDRQSTENDSLPTNWREILQLTHWQ